MTGLSQRKDRFLVRTRVHSQQAALDNALAAALQHNRTYSTLFGTARAGFRSSLKGQLLDRGLLYCSPVSDEAHVANIEGIAEALSEKHHEILEGGRLRIGTAQKALNLYLKFMWCLDPYRPTPPHCPVDGVVLAAARIPGAWTRLDLLELYLDWIRQLRTLASEWATPIWQNGSLIPGRVTGAAPAWISHISGRGTRRHRRGLGRRCIADRWP